MNVPTVKRTKLSVTMRPARITDIGALLRLYRNRSEESKSTYHPFPFDRIRLSAIYLWMTIARRGMRFMIRRMPRRAATLLVAVAPDGSQIIGYGTVRLMSGRGEEPIALFGYLVSDAYQGQGVGGQIIRAMLLTAKGLGVRRGGGTVLQQNVASAHLIQQFGWQLGQAAPDRGAPGAVNMATVADIDDLLKPRGNRDS
jgi:RimJ/RimL family protein N-acetyltransferase